MPYLRFDVPERYPPEVKREAARDVGEAYARIMETTSDRVRVAFRELADASLLQCTEGDPRPTAVISCDVRRGRTVDQRAALARALVETCRRRLGLRCEILVQFTQHDGDDFYRSTRGWAEDWTAAEAVEKTTA